MAVWWQVHNSAIGGYLYMVREYGLTFMSPSPLDRIYARFIANIIEAQWGAKPLE